MADDKASVSWFLRLNNQTTGPFAEDDLRRRLQAGELSEQDPCWRDGLPGWITIREALSSDSPLPLALHYAGFWIRLIAICLDTILWFLATVIITVILSFLLRRPIDGLPMGWIMVAVSLLYFGFLQGFLQGTPGKRLLGLRVLMKDSRPMGWPTGLLRYAAFMLTNAFAGIGSLVAAFTSRKQALYDYLVKTIVIRDNVGGGKNG